MSWNVPDDWNSFWRTCSKHGTRWHASEGECPECEREYDEESSEEETEEESEDEEESDEAGDWCCKSGRPAHMRDEDWD